MACTEGKGERPKHEYKGWQGEVPWGVPPRPAPRQAKTRPRAWAGAAGFIKTSLLQGAAGFIKTSGKHPAKQAWQKSCFGKINFCGSPAEKGGLYG